MDRTESLEIMERLMRARVYEYGGGPRFEDLFRPTPGSNTLPESEPSPRPPEKNDADIGDEHFTQEAVPANV